MKFFSAIVFASCFLLSIFASHLLSPCYGQQPTAAAQLQPGRVFVEVDDEWITPGHYAVSNRRDPNLKAYLVERDHAEDTLEGQVKLAQWCDDHDLDEQRDAHLKRALVHAPDDLRVRKKLGHKNVGGTWLSKEQFDNAKAHQQATRERWKDWKKPVARISRMLKSNSVKTQRVGLATLGNIDDPRSITALERILSDQNELVASRTLDVISRFSEREATESVMRNALFSPWKSIRTKANSLLSERNRFDFVPTLLEQMVSPVSTRFAITEDARGNALYQFALFQQNMDQDNVLEFETLLLQNPRTAVNLWPNLSLQAWRRSQIAEQQVDQLNVEIKLKNQAIQSVLAESTGVSQLKSPEEWWQWWFDENEVTIFERPVSYKLIQETEMTTEQRPGAVGECLVAGTPVWTALGFRPVETLTTGDRVLCEDVQSRKLEYRTVIQPTQRPPTPTFRIVLNGETIQASGGHLFWVEGQGWTKTRDLKPNMQLRTANAVAAKVSTVRKANSVPLYNLIVEGRSNYFVGGQGLLSHDSTIRKQGEKSVELAAGY